jgi:hypothetical protein
MSSTHLYKDDETISSVFTSNGELKYSTSKQYETLLLISSDEAMGGIKLASGRVYFTPPSEYFSWYVDSGFQHDYTNLPLRYMKTARTHSPLLRFEDDDAQEISDIILDAYLNGFFAMTSYDPIEVQAEHDKIREYRAKFKAASLLMDEFNAYVKEAKKGAPTKWNKEWVGSTRNQGILRARVK